MEVEILTREEIHKIVDDKLKKPYLNIEEASHYTTFSVHYLRKNTTLFISLGIAYRKNSKIIFLRDKLDEWMLEEYSNNGINHKPQRKSVSEYIS